MRIGFIGAGQMAQALAGGIISSGMCSASNITISDPFPAAIKAFKSNVGEVQVASSNADCGADCDFLILAVKPQYFEAAVAAMNAVNPNTTVISVMSGIQMERIGEALGTNRIIRVMPNTPCLFGAGSCGVSVSLQVEVAAAKQVLEMLDSMGKVVQVQESQLDAITGLSGSGPAYVFTFIEALADGGVLMGLSRDQSLQLAAQTVFGAAKMVLESGDHPAVLRDRVASPGGTTIHGLEALELGGMRAAIIDAVRCATERSQDLG